jgi:hypothetical protein
MLLQTYASLGLALSTALPTRPPSGSIMLYDKSKTKRWRQDGYKWKGKSDRHMRYYITFHFIILVIF